MKRVVIFSRVSKSEMDLTRQQSQLKAICEQNNYLIIEDFSEKISGAKGADDRIVFNQFIDFVLNKKNEVDGVLVHEISRLGRKISVTAKALEDLHAAGIWVYSLKENVYTLNEDGTINSNALLLINIMQSLAVNERDNLIYRVNSGIHQSVYINKNAFGGVAPFGYKRVNKKFIIDEEEADVIKNIFDLYLNKNMGCMQIAMYLNEKQIKTRFQKIDKTFKLKNTIVSPKNMKWSDGQVNKILKNKLYAGIRIHNKTNEIELPECKIIELDDYNAVQDKLKSNYNKKGINTKFKYLIDNQRIFCGECGSTYYPHKRLNGKDNAYKCLTKRYDYKDGNKCSNNAININKLSFIIWKCTRNTDELIKQLEENKNNNTFINQYNQKESELKGKIREIADIAKEENKILDLHLNNLISKDIYTQRFKNIQLKKNTLDYQCKILANEMIELKKSIDNMNDLNSQLRAIKANTETMKEYVMMIVKKVIIHKVKGNFNYTGISTDVANVIEIQLYTTDKSQFYLLSRWSKKYVKLEEKDFVNNEIVCSLNKLKTKEKNINTDFKIK